MVLAQPAEVLRDRLLIALRHVKRVGASDLTRLLLIELPAQPKLQVVHSGEHPRVKLFLQGRVPVTPRSEPLKIAHQFLEIGLCGGFAGNSTAQAIQLPNGSLA